MGDTDLDVDKILQAIDGGDTDIDALLNMDTPGVMDDDVIEGYDGSIDINNLVSDDVSALLAEAGIEADEQENAIESTDKDVIDAVGDEELGFEQDNAVVSDSQDSTDFSVSNTKEVDLDAAGEEDEIEERIPVESNVSLDINIDSDANVPEEADIGETDNIETSNYINDNTYPEEHFEHDNQAAETDDTAGADDGVYDGSDDGVWDNEGIDIGETDLSNVDADALLNDLLGEGEGEQLEGEEEAGIIDDVDIQEYQEFADDGIFDDGVYDGEGEGEGEEDVIPEPQIDVEEYTEDVEAEVEVKEEEVIAAPVVVEEKEKKEKKEEEKPKHHPPASKIPMSPKSPKTQTATAKPSMTHTEKILQKKPELRGDLYVRARDQQKRQQEREAAAKKAKESAEAAEHEEYMKRRRRKSSGLRSAAAAAVSQKQKQKEGEGGGEGEQYDFVKEMDKQTKEMRQRAAEKQKKEDEERKQLARPKINPKSAKLAGQARERQRLGQMKKKEEEERKEKERAEKEKEKKKHSVEESKRAKAKSDALYQVAQERAKQREARKAAEEEKLAAARNRGVAGKHSKTYARDRLRKTTNDALQTAIDEAGSEVLSRALALDVLVDVRIVSYQQARDAIVAWMNEEEENEKNLAVRVCYYLDPENTNEVNTEALSQLINTVHDEKDTGDPLIHALIQSMKVEKMTTPVNQTPVRSEPVQEAKQFKARPSPIKRPGARSSASADSGVPRHELLYREAMARKKKEEEKKKRIQQAEDVDCTFTPELMGAGESGDTLSGSSRMEALYELGKNKVQEKAALDRASEMLRRTKQDEEDEAEATFQPDMSKSKARSRGGQGPKTPSHVPRGYLERIERDKRVRQQKEEEKKRADHLLAGHVRSKAALSASATPPRAAVSKPSSSDTGSSGGVGGSVSVGVGKRQPMMHINVDLGPRRSGKIAVYEGDDIATVASNFARAYQLDDVLKGRLVALLEDELEPKCAGLVFNGQAIEGKALHAVTTYRGAQEGESSLRWYRLPGDVDTDEALGELDYRNEDVSGAVFIDEGSDHTCTVEDVGHCLLLEYIPTRIDGQEGQPAISRSPKVKATGPAALNVSVMVVDHGDRLIGSADYIGGRAGACRHVWVRVDGATGARAVVKEAETAEYAVNPEVDYGCIFQYGFVPVRIDGVQGQLVFSDPTPKLSFQAPCIVSAAFSEPSPVEGTTIEIKGKFKNCDAAQCMFTWYRGDDPIPGHSGIGMVTYTPVLADEGYIISCVCHAQDSRIRGIVEGSADEDVRVTAKNPVTVGVPRVSSIELVGSPLHTTTWTMRAVYEGGSPGQCIVRWVRTAVQMKSDSGEEGEGENVGIAGAVAEEVPQSEVFVEVNDDEATIISSKYTSCLVDAGRKLVVQVVPVREDGMKGRPGLVESLVISIDSRMTDRAGALASRGRVEFESTSVDGIEKGLLIFTESELKFKLAGKRSSKLKVPFRTVRAIEPHPRRSEVIVVKSSSDKYEFCVKSSSSSTSSSSAIRDLAILVGRQMVLAYNDSHGEGEGEGEGEGHGVGAQGSRGTRILRGLSLLATQRQR